MSFYFLLLFTCVLLYNEARVSNVYKTSRFGEIYDCVDLYKQSSYGPLIMNHSFHHQMRPNLRSRSIDESLRTKKAELKRTGSPVGTFPIRRILNDDSKIKSFVPVREPSGTYVAGVRTKAGSAKYSGGGMITSVYNPRTMPGAYSLARIKISSGPDAIQVGWRVDPSLRGDNLTRTTSLSCFDAKCGFVLVNTTFLLDDTLEPISQPGVRPKWEYKLYIIRDPQSGNWWLFCGFSNNKVGFWPKHIFSGLRDLATSVEWAGEVYSPPGVYEPLMGSSYRPSVGDTDYVAYFREIQVLNEDNAYLDAYNVEEFATDRSLYDVKDEGNVGGGFGHLIFFGGARY